MESTTPRASSAAVRQRILDGAALAFAELGFTAAGVDEIARRAGVNKAMLYYHVGDKATLFREVVLGVVRAIKAELDAADAPGRGPAERLAGVPAAVARVAAEQPWFAQIMLRELAAGGVHLPTDVLVEITGILAITRSAVADGVRQGEFRDVNPLLVHLILIGSLLFIANASRMRERLARLQALPPNLPQDLDAVARAVADIVLHGVARRERRKGRP
ncbi:MAG TPA: TetR/AcrR family transcriptional regulator [Thermoanaerobaculaceae bacterium]|nr:TetR/AcrR family transcriptional regulator [Thermoanaerobaculaceae bacterium]